MLSLFKPWQNWVAQPIRSIPNQNKSIYLTFDDGPDPEMLPDILRILKNHGCPSTFFMVANKAQKQKSLVEQVIQQGHSIGNHSLDHSYSVFFAGREKLKDWILESESILNEVCGQTPVGFRPPNGVCPPHLQNVLNELKIPLILWNQRFFDTIFPFTEGRAKAGLARTQSGDIVLLHDSMRHSLRQLYLRNLDRYLGEAKSLGFEFAVLTKEI